MTPQTEDLITLIEGRIGQDFDGEAHLTDIEARSIAQALRALQAEVERLRGALKVFADCADELDGNADIPPAPDGEWAKFRLLTDDYRRARSALTGSAQG